MQQPVSVQPFEAYQQQYVVCKMWQELQELRAAQQHFNQHVLNIFALQEGEARAISTALQEIKEGVAALNGRMDVIAENMDKVQQLLPYTKFRELPDCPANAVYQPQAVKNRVAEN